MKNQGWAGDTKEDSMWSWREFGVMQKGGVSQYFLTLREFIKFNRLNKFICVA